MSSETPLFSTHVLFCAALQRLGGAAIFPQRSIQKAAVAPLLPPDPNGTRKHAVSAEFETPSDAGTNPLRGPDSGEDVTQLDTPHCQDNESDEGTGAATLSAKNTLYEQLVRREVAMPSQDAQVRLHHLRLFSAKAALVDGATAPSLLQEGRNASAVANDTHVGDGRSSASELKARYFQVAKETLTAFIGLRLRSQLLSDHNTAGNDTALLAPAQCRAAEASSDTTAARQAALRRGMEVFMKVVAHQESMLNTVASACKSNRNTDEAAAPAPRPCFFLSSLLQTPMMHWAGSHVYSNPFVRCPTPSVSLTPSKAAEREKNAPRGTLRLTPSCATRGLAKTLVLPQDIEAELRKYWKLHNETAARARLDALRCQDAEAFAEHISLLKVSALLTIMEKTEGFMHRVGLRLQLHAAQATTDRGGDDRVAVHTMRAGSAALGEPGAAYRPGGAAGCRGSDYDRFRAYVASTKNEFKLMHRVDVFVATQPAGLNAVLLPHQMDGLRFLASLDANHINGILADEMGVGKTIQTLAFLLYLKNRRSKTAEGTSGRGAPLRSGPRLPHLILAPLSVIREWREACERFVPSALRVAVYRELADPVLEAAAYDLVLLPVHAVRYVGAEAARIRWHYVVVDEAHKAVANLNTMTARCILGLPCLRRLVLTGTPLSSDLQELWSLLHFLNPEVFTDSDAFEEIFRRPFRVYEAREMELTEEERGLLILRLHQVLRPFLLRRTKADVDANLQMTFHRVWCPLTAMQQRLLCILREQRRTPALLRMAGGHSSTSSSSSEADGESEAAAAGAADKATLTSTFPAEGIGAGVSAICARSMTAAASTAEVLHGKASVALDILKAHDEAATAGDELGELIWRHLPALASTESKDALRRAVQQDRALGFTSAGVSESSAQLLCNHAFLLPFFSQVLHRHGLNEAAQEGCNNTGSVAAAVTESSTPGAEAAERYGAAGLTLACSGKFLVLHLLLSRLYVAQRKVVLFTHWLDCVDLLVDYLHSRGWTDHMEVLTGGSSEAERLASVRRFREDPACLFFLLSIKAGGCGINLQAAHMVVLVDRDYTATNEDQALARVYRIGQRYTVRAVYLATTDASEQRVAQRAAAKNKPRQAIINDGVYQVASASEAERVRGSGEAVTTAAVAAPPPNTDNDLDTCELWSSVSGAGSPPLPTCEVREARELGCDGVVCGAAGSLPLSLPLPESYWVALSRLVDSIDGLVLTEEDRAVATVTSPEEVGCGAGCAPTNSAAARLLATRPPRSTAELHLRLRRESDGMHPAPWRDDGAALQVNSIAAVDVKWEAGRGHAEVQAAGECTSRSTPSEPRAAALVAQPLPTTPSAPATDPVQNSALFWLEYSHLLRMAWRGPCLLSDSLRAAAGNDARKNDPEEQARRRQRRDRRAAKRMRLVSVDVPDSFREACWMKEGIDDDAEVAARYLRFLDARASKRRQRRRGDTV
ncbi:hypothetical protein GH5_02694 [Leishmania sp. Ghana 2012 LV757]|uniref:hypothetical protein n=1 Tax=Leishmania sp. Ghana 2012 LV757 TaxID=2803181 RepID=UPI001B459F86|nr:hypothetical protein GH5_02694 [Leishmania sp. Ghana 2012 LV757]